MAVIAPPRQPDSRDVESTIEPDRGGEALIEEAKQHARRRRRRVAVTATVASLAVAGAVTAGLVAGGAGSSPSGPSSIEADAGVPPVGSADGEQHVQAVASWEGFHQGWVTIFSDGRVLWAFDISDWMNEHRLSPAALDRVLLGRVAAQHVWSDTSHNVRSDDSDEMYVANEFAACPFEQRGINSYPVPATSVFHLLPNEVRDVVAGTERIIPNARFPQREEPAGWPTEQECFALNATQASAFARLGGEPSPPFDEPQPGFDPRDDPWNLVNFTTDGAEPLWVGLAPMMPDGSKVAWGG